MLAVDTNILARAITQDHPEQTARAATLLRSQEIWISKTVILELEWVLRRSYGFGKSRTLAALRSLAGPPSQGARVYRGGGSLAVRKTLAAA